jgi:hypothetical protein
MRAPLRQKSRDMLPGDQPLGQALGRMIDA